MAKGIIIQPEVGGKFPLPVEAVKMRELNGDTTVYALTGHRPDQRRLLTVTSKLPTPRKGNPGTVKSTVHLLADQPIYNTVNGVETVKMVPTVTKIETSYPVGTDADSLWLDAKNVAAALLLSPNDFKDFFCTGIPLEIYNNSIA